MYVQLLAIKSDKTWQLIELKYNTNYLNNHHTFNPF